MILSMAQMGNDGTLWSIDATAGLAQCYVGNGRWSANANRKMKAVSCASAGQVWGIDSAGKACRLTSSAVQTSSAGTAVSVGGRTGPLYVAGQNGITWTDAAGKSGTIPYPSTPLSSFAATDTAQGGHALWATTGDYTVNPPRFTTLFWDGSAWQNSGGPGFNALSIGLDNSVWGYIGNGQLLSPGLYLFNSQGQWVLTVKSPTGGLMQSYTVVQSYDIWAVDNNLKLYRWNGQSWFQQGDGSPSWVGNGWDGAVYGLNTLLAGAPQPLQRFNGFSQWVPMPLTITYFNNFASRDSTGLWWGSRQVLEFWPGAVWQDMGGAVLATISGAADGTVWGTDPNNAILRFNGSSWDSMPGQAKQVSVGRSDLVWSLDVNGNSQRWTGSGWEAHGNPGSAITCIAALGDGTVLASASVSQSFGPNQSVVFLWNGTTWAATAMVADQIAGADINHLAGVTRGAQGKGGDLVLGNISPPQVAPADLQNVDFAPPNPVYTGTTMTLSWAAFPAAVGYAVKIASNTTGVDVNVTGTSASYTLQTKDMFGWLQGTVQALDGSGTIVAQGSARYYCGNNVG